MKRNFAIVFTCALFAVLSCFGVSAATSENATNEMTIEQLTNLYVVSAPDFFEVFLEQKILANDFGMEKVSGIEGGLLYQAHTVVPPWFAFYIFT